jgi:hypothetical protein
MRIAGAKQRTGEALYGVGRGHDVHVNQFRVSPSTAIVYFVVMIANRGDEAAEYYAGAAE